MSSISWTTCRTFGSSNRCNTRILFTCSIAAGPLSADLGGVQEEAPTFGRHILITRLNLLNDPKSSPLDFGILVGSDYGAIVGNARRLTSGRPFADFGCRQPVWPRKCVRENRGAAGECRPTARRRYAIRKRQVMSKELRESKVAWKELTQFMVAAALVAAGASGACCCRPARSFRSRRHCHQAAHRGGRAMAWRLTRIRGVCQPRRQRRGRPEDRSGRVRTTILRSLADLAADRARISGRLAELYARISGGYHAASARRRRPPNRRKASSRRCRRPARTAWLYTKRCTR